MDKLVILTNAISRERGGCARPGGRRRDVVLTAGIISVFLSGCSPTAPNGIAHSSHLNTLSGVTCPTSTFCVAVGDSFDLAPMGSTSAYIHHQTLIEQWDGSSWSIVSSPNGKTEDTFLAKVSCASSSLCFAVGHSLIAGIPNASPDVTMVIIERWDGHSWTLGEAPAPDLKGVTPSLTDIACANASLCFAVGEYRAFANGVSSAGTLIDQWNGTGWVLSRPPTPDDGGLFLPLGPGVACTGVSLCLTAGSYSFTLNEFQTVFDRWAGSSWSSVSSHNIGSGDHFLGSVSCASPKLCFSVGRQGPPFGNTYQTLIEQWNGSTWSMVPSPTSHQRLNELNSVTCTSATRCYAVGSTGDLNNSPTAKPTINLVEQWNGTSWAVIPSPSVTTPQNQELSGVACPRPSLCFAVGDYITTDGDSQTLIEQLHGGSWSIVSSPNR